MKIGVSGASGHLGRAVVSELLQRPGGHECVRAKRSNHHEEPRESPPLGGRARDQESRENGGESGHLYSERKNTSLDSIHR